MLYLPLHISNLQYSNFSPTSKLIDDFKINRFSRIRFEFSEGNERCIIWFYITADEQNCYRVIFNATAHNMQFEKMVNNICVARYQIILNQISV